MTNLELKNSGLVYDPMDTPNCTLTTTNHLLEPELRRKAYQYYKRIKICDNVWLGSNVVVLPGVTIGELSAASFEKLPTVDTAKMPPLCL